MPSKYDENTKARAVRLADKAIVDESSTRTAVAEVTAD